MNGDKLITDLYVKPTDRNNLLLYNSNHPRKIMESLLRVRRIVSQESAKDYKLDDMCKKFLVGGYPRRLSVNILRKLVI